MVVSLAISRVRRRALERIGSDLGVAWWLFLVNATLAGMVLGLT